MTRNSGRANNPSIQLKSMALVPPLSGGMTIQNFARNPVLVNHRLSTACYRTQTLASDLAKSLPRQSCHRFQGKPATPPVGAALRATLGKPIGILRLSHTRREEQMPAQRLSMRHVTEVLRLKWGQGLSDRKIAQSLGISRPTVAEYVRRAQAAGLSWAMPASLDETAVERLLFPPHPAIPIPPRPEPDWPTVHHELKRKGVTLFLLWQEYKSTTPEGFQYSRFCQGYRAWTGKLDLVMRQSHRAGEKLFVDYAGQGIPVVNPHSGEVHEVAIFVAVLGASNYTYAEATWTQSLPDWIGSH